MKERKQCQKQNIFNNKLEISDQKLIPILQAK